MIIQGSVKILGKFIEIKDAFSFYCPQLHIFPYT